jgi:hypothetical protein
MLHSRVCIVGIKWTVGTFDVVCIVGVMYIVSVDLIVDNNSVNVDDVGVKVVGVIVSHLTPPPVS